MARIDVEENYQAGIRTRLRYGIRRIKCNHQAEGPGSFFLGFFTGADEDTGVKVTNYQFARYCTLHDGLRKMLQSVGYRMEIKFTQAEKKTPVTCR